jgi:hypothetical protein
VLPLALHAGSEVLMDCGYTDCSAEDTAKAADQITFSTCRKKNSKRRGEPAREYYKAPTRKRMERAFSQVTPSRN